MHLVDRLPSFEEINHGDLFGFSLNAKTNALTHGLHRFPAKYIPQIPRWAFSNLSDDQSVILDPFMGSGTTLVEGLKFKNKTFGIDIDPLAQMIAAAKIEQYSASRLAKLASQLLSLENAESYRGEKFLPMTGVKNPGHWFSDKNWLDLCGLWRGIESLSCTEVERRFFLCVFSSILRWVSNADDQTQKTYVSGTLKKSPPQVWGRFKRSLSNALSGVNEMDLHRGGGEAEILSGSALDIPLDEKSVDLIITSPPYMDSVDYMYNFMLEYFWLGPHLGISSRDEYNKVRREPVGAKNPNYCEELLPESIRDIIQLEEVKKYRQKAVIGYFHSMQAHFREAARVLKDGARYHLVVGNSQSQSGVITVHDCMLRLARNEGLHLEKAFAYRIRRHYMKFPRKGRGGIILMDWVVTLRKSGRALISFEDRLPTPNVTIGADEVAH